MPTFHKSNERVDLSANDHFFFYPKQNANGERDWGKRESKRLHYEKLTGGHKNRKLWGDGIFLFCCL